MGGLAPHELLLQRSIRVSGAVLLRLRMLSGKREPLGFVQNQHVKTCKYFNGDKIVKEVEGVTQLGSVVIRDPEAFHRSLGGLHQKLVCINLVRYIECGPVGPSFCPRLAH